jgi:hypothetical protein
VDEARLAEDLEVVGDGRLTDVDGVHDLAGGHRAGFRGQEVQDQDARGIAERLEPAGPCRGVVAGDRHRVLTIIDGVVV